MAAPLTVAETPEYIRRAEALLSPAERNDLAGLVRLLKQAAENRR